MKSDERTRLWLLNLDADVELERGANYQPTRKLLEHARAQGELSTQLTRGEEVLERDALPDAARLRAWRESGALLFWCPTPSVLRLGERLGLAHARGPALEILRRVNHRRFALSVETASGQRWLDPGASLDWLEQVPDGGLRLKRAHGFAGRGQRVIGRTPSADDRRWVRDSLRAGLLVEPELSVLAEWCIHGYVDERGVLLGEPCRQWCDAFGRVERLQRAALGGTSLQRVRGLAERTAARLSEAGYFGPFGLDLLSSVEHGPDHPSLSDLNARFTLGWSIGMGESREPALARLLARG